MHPKHPQIQFPQSLLGPTPSNLDSPTACRAPTTRGAGRTCHAGVDGGGGWGSEAWGGGTSALVGASGVSRVLLVPRRSAGDEGAVSWRRAGSADAASGGAGRGPARRGDLFRRCAGAIGSGRGVGARESCGVSAIICRGGEGAR